MTEAEIKTHFERNLTELGLLFSLTDDNRYSLNRVCITQPKQIQFIVSEPVKESNSISPNGNVIQSICQFKLDSIKNLAGIDYYAMAFQNQDDQFLDFIIIPSKELQERIRSVNISRSKKKIVELIFWLMPERHLYEVKGISPEGEWYYLSMGRNGRIADSTYWNYSQYLNNWDLLIQENTYC